MRREHRLWGWFLKLLHTKRFWIKLLRVKGRTSLQKHQKRTEYHIGITKIEPGDEHRLQKGFFIEFAVGEPDEYDIIRLADDYGRE